MRKLFISFLIVICSFEFLNCAKINKRDVNKEPSSKTKDNEDLCNLRPELVEEIEGYQDIVNRIIFEFNDGKYEGKIYESISEIEKKFQRKFTGTKELEDAIDYVIDEMKSNGLENVHTEGAIVIDSNRNSTAELLSPKNETLAAIGLARTVATPEEGIIADAIVVESFDELHALPDGKVKDKIVIFVPKWKGYYHADQYRVRGATEASKKGAIATLIRSVAPFPFEIPHTGMQDYEDGVKKIPTAAIPFEEAEKLLKMYKNGERIKIYLNVKDGGELSRSRNSIGELTGTVHENKSVVVLSGHLDSWQYLDDAFNDIGGAFISWKSLQFLKDMGLRPKRTLRAILWTGDKFGMMGAKSYLEAHKQNEKEEFNFFLESDFGRDEPEGLEYTGNKEAGCILKEILKLMKPLNATKFKTPMNGGPDIDLWASRGFPGATLYNNNQLYFNKMFVYSVIKLIFPPKNIILEHPINLDKSASLFAAIGYVIADLSVDMPKNVKK